MALFGDFDPFSGLRRVQRELERLVDPLARSAGRYFAGGTEFPPITLAEGEGEFIVVAQMPGVPLEAIDLSLTGDSLVLRGQKKAPDGYDQLPFYRKERDFGKFARTVVLPAPVNPAACDAFFRDGVLTIRMRRVEPERPRSVPINTGPKA